MNKILLNNDANDTYNHPSGMQILLTIPFQTTHDIYEYKNRANPTIPQFIIYFPFQKPHKTKTYTSTQL